MQLAAKKVMLGVPCEILILLIDFRKVMPLVLVYCMRKECYFSMEFKRKE